MNPKHVVIIGAARSGTKILRDALAEATDAGRVPYDIGYVWRIGNDDRPDDVIPPERVSERSRRFIRKFVDHYAAGDPLAVIEKTVGNTVRIPTVAAVFPDAVFVHVVRDGVDVIESTRRQWTLPADFRYLLRKSRHFPLRLVPTYGGRYLASTLRRRSTADRRVGVWGVRYPGIVDDLRDSDLLTVCARQWRESVLCAGRDLELLRPPLIRLRYEDLVCDPARELTRVIRFLGLTEDTVRVGRAASTVVQGRSGVGRRALTADECRVVDLEAGDLLRTLGYQSALAGSDPS